MPEYLTPGVYIEYRDQAPAVRGLRTDIAGFVGLAERGPLNAPARIESWRHFQSLFGGLLRCGYLAYAVKGFFENGGKTCYIVRVAGAGAAGAKLVLKNAANQDAVLIEAKNEGTWGNRIVITLDVNPAERRFTLQAARGGPDYERFENLSADRNSERYFERMVNEGNASVAPSRLITARPAKGLLPADDPIPDAAASGLNAKKGSLSAGRDGIASLTIGDILGTADPLAEEPKGLNALYAVDAVAVICIPDLHIRPVPPPAKPAPPRVTPHDPCIPCANRLPPAVPYQEPLAEQPPLFSDVDRARAQRAMIEHCEQRRDRVAILDAPLTASGETMTIGGIRNWRNELASDRGFGALYYPWVKVLDPAPGRVNPTRPVPPCGHIAGLYARTDLTAGVHRAPANAELSWAEDLTAPINEETQAVLNPAGVNCLRAFPGRGIRVYGARTVSGDPDWRYVNVRRLMIMIEEAVDKATQWSVFEPHTAMLRQTLVMSVSSFLETLWRGGALKGAVPEEAFYVKCDDTNNPPEVVGQGKLIVDVGVAPAIPAEFIVFRIGRTLEELEIVER